MSIEQSIRQCAVNAQTKSDASLAASYLGSLKGKPTVRKTPNCLHAYRATLRGFGTYGWGNTPDEARSKLAANITKSGEKQLR
jgi:hypothetical protein